MSSCCHFHVQKLEKSPCFDVFHPSFLPGCSLTCRLRRSEGGEGGKRDGGDEQRHLQFSQAHFSHKKIGEKVETKGEQVEPLTLPKLHTRGTSTQAVLWIRRSFSVKVQPTPLAFDSFQIRGEFCRGSGFRFGFGRFAKFIDERVDVCLKRVDCGFQLAVLQVAVDLFAFSAGGA